MGAVKQVNSLLLILSVLAAPHFSWAATTRTIVADTIKNAANTTTQTLPASTGTILNTVSTNVPVAASLVQETPSGSCNGSNVTLTLANTPGGSASVILFIDGIIQTQGGGNDYTISGATITLATACAAGQETWAHYSKF